MWWFNEIRLILNVNKFTSTQVSSVIDIFIRDQQIASISRLKMEIKNNIKEFDKAPKPYIEKASHNIHISVAKFTWAIL